MFDDWDESLRYIPRNSDHECIHRSLFVLPAPHTWEHVPGVTLLGAAAHLMPLAGLGANLAMLDGTDLAHALATESSVDDAVRAYESIMLPRSIEAATGSAKGLENQPSTLTQTAPEQGKRQSAAGVLEVLAALRGG
ncbi:FAD-dependent oxidoreductase [Streptomyces sp. NPDC001852]|uniref:FAD-dependent oxidoreductase n=1 Tax=Streptomyces sp. NPDC001852 TaxID=3364619 RepID=UPI00369B9BF4